MVPKRPSNTVQGILDEVARSLYQRHARAGNKQRLGGRRTQDDVGGRTDAGVVVGRGSPSLRVVTAAQVRL